jgi:hypothetical protein
MPRGADTAARRARTALTTRETLPHALRAQTASAALLATAALAVIAAVHYLRLLVAAVKSAVFVTYVFPTNTEARRCRTRSVACAAVVR